MPILKWTETKSKPCYTLMIPKPIHVKELKGDLSDVEVVEYDMQPWSGVLWLKEKKKKQISFIKYLHYFLKGYSVEQIIMEEYKVAEFTIYDPKIIFTL